VKILKGPIYEGRLADFATIFANRRKELSLALSIHSTLGVDKANLTIDEVHRSVRAVDEKLSMILLFRKLESPYEKELLEAVSTRGGVKACLENNDALKELTTISQKQVSRSFAAGPPGIQWGAKLGSQDKDEKAAFDDLKKELAENVEETLEKNLVVFERKLGMQMRQIQTELEGAIQREGDRVITAVISGPHDRIIDPVGCDVMLLINFVHLTMFLAISGLARHLGRNGMPRSIAYLEMLMFGSGLERFSQGPPFCPCAPRLFR
jgi:hypothetical protein